jgi:hypothetical protein
MHSLRPLVSVPAFKDLIAEGVLKGYTQQSNTSLFEKSTINALKDEIDRFVRTSARIQYVLKRVE